MALFSFGKERKEGGGSQLVLAYLEDALRIRCPFIFQDPRKNEIQATLQGIDEEEGTFSLQFGGSIVAEKGAKVGAIFHMENTRIGIRTRIVNLRPGLVDLELPEELDLLERRKCPRARLNPREGATLTALTGLFEGIGISGTIENISEGGTRVRVEKAMNIKGEKKLPMGISLVPVGQNFIIVKLNKMPKCPTVMELTGHVSYADASSGLCVGIIFEKPRQDFVLALRNLVSGRSAAILTAVPPRARRSQEAPEDSLLPSKAEGSKAAAEDPNETPKTPEKMPLAETKPVAEPALPASAPSPAPENSEGSSTAPPNRNAALLKLKKRTRTILIAALAGAGRDLLAEHLVEEGYGRVLQAGSLNELVEHLRQPNIGLVIIDGGLPEAWGLELVNLMHKIAEELPPILLAANDVGTTLVLDARAAGVAQLIVKPYVLDDAFSDLLETQMGLA